MISSPNLLIMDCQIPNESTSTTLHVCEMMYSALVQLQDTILKPLCVNNLIIGSTTM